MNKSTELKIALCGKTRVGKDTVGDYLTKKYGMFQFAFADKLKEMFHDEYTGVPKYPKPVRGYQLYGQLMRYVYGEDYWVDRCFDYIDTVGKYAYGFKEMGNKETPALRPVITDIRQKNEIDRCKLKGYILIRVNSDENIRIDRMNQEGDNFSKEDLDFETEKSIDGFEVDYDIYNNGDLKELYAQIDEIVNKEAGRVYE